jgi:HEAT repeat protein
MTTPAALVGDLSEAGVPVTDLWELVNGKKQYRAAVPVLIEWLNDLDRRVPAPDREKVREGLVRALTIPAARPAAAPALLAQFRAVADPTGVGPRWVIGNALEVVADDSVFEEVAALARDRSYGRARQMPVLGLGRSRDPRAVPLLVELLDDPDVAAHAAMALGKLGAPAARPALERLAAGGATPAARKEAKKALARLG